MKQKGIWITVVLLVVLLLGVCFSIRYSFNHNGLDQALVGQVEENRYLLDAFLAGEIPAIYAESGDSAIWFDQLPVSEEDWISYSVGERIDLDNDGEDELIVDGPYGGIYFDARDGKVYVLAEGEGTAGMLSHTEYDGAA